MAGKKRGSPGNEALGKRMREIRKPVYQNLIDLARKMHIRPDHLGKIERGLMQAWDSDIDDFCAAFERPQQYRAELFKLLHTRSRSETSIPASSLLRQPLMLGAQESTVVIIDGNGTAAIPIENINLKIDPEPAEMPRRFRDFYDEYCRRVAERKQHGDPQAPYDGQIYSINTITLTRTPGSELPSWIIALKRNRYYQYAALATNLTTAYEHEGRRNTLFREYLGADDFDPRRPPSFLSLFGITSAVYLRPEKRLVIVKKGSTELYPNSLGAAVAEGLNPCRDIVNPQNPSAAIMHCILEGAKEELGEAFAAALNPVDIVLLSLAFNWHACEYTIMSLISADFTLDELKRSVLTAKDGKFEISDIYTMPAQPIEQALRELFKQTRRVNSHWNPLGLGTMLMALCFLNPSTYYQCDAELGKNPAYLGEHMPTHLLFPWSAP